MIKKKGRGNSRLDSDQRMVMTINNQLEKDMSLAGVDKFTFGDLRIAQSKAMGDKDAVYSWERPQHDD